MGAEFSSCSTKQCEDLLVCAHAGNVQDCTRLLTKKRHAANVNCSDVDGLTALHYASFSGRHTASRFLHDIVGESSSSSASSPASSSYSHAHSPATHSPHLLDCTKSARMATNTALVLLEHGAQVRAQEHHMGFSPLHLASCYGNAGLVRVLLQHDAGAALLRDRFGKTALHWACQNAHTSVCAALLLVAADDDEACKAQGEEDMVNALDVHGRTPLHWAAAYGNTAECALLLAHGARVDLMDAKRFTAVHLAVHFHHHDAVRVLRRYELWCDLLVVRSAREIPRVGSRSATRRLPDELFYMVTEVLI